MSKRLCILLFLFFCGFVCHAAAENPSPSVNGRLHVSGNGLADQNGTPVQLRGLSTHGLSWYPGYVNRDCFVQLREDFGCSVVRLAMYTDEYGGYCSSGDRDRLKELVLQGVSFAREADLYVIVDWHILSDHDPNIHAEEALAFFDEIAPLLADQPHVLYEICNEPNSGTTWSDIRRYAEQVIPVIRSHDPGTVIIIGTPDWCQQIGQAAADPITGWNDLMYSLHFYSATHGQWLRNALTKALQKGLPVFVTEFGPCAADANGQYDFTEADRWLDLLDSYGISHCMWSISNKAELTSVFLPGCGKLSGFVYEDLTEGGKWLVDRYGGALSGNHEFTGEVSAPAADPDNLCSSGIYGAWVDEGAGANAEVNTGRDSFTVRVKASGLDSYRVQPACYGLSLEQGKRYTLSFTVSCSKKLTFGVRLQQNYGAYLGYWEKGSLEMSPGEKAYSFTFTMNSPSDDNTVLVFNVGGWGSLMYNVELSQIRLEEVH